MFVERVVLYSVVIWPRKVCGFVRFDSSGIALAYMQSCEGRCDAWVISKIHGVVSYGLFHFQSLFFTHSLL